jgi:putative tryptophan/tyrosine transport system substrate-binding protein
MDRRFFIGSLVLGAFVVPGVARAQPARKIHRIGLLGIQPTSEMAGPQPQAPHWNALLSGLRELGYVYGEHFLTEPRGSGGKPERVTSLAAELIRLQVDVIVAAGTTLPVLKQATSTIPVVMAAGADPVEQGFVQSLGHPGGNFTGLSWQETATMLKRLELLKELVPGAAPVAVLRDTPPGPATRQALVAATRERGWKLLFFEIRDADEIEETFTAVTRARAAAVLVTGGAVLAPQARRVAELAARGRLPAIFNVRGYVDAGGLISYAADTNDIFRRAAAFVDKILKGAKPADLPIEQPTKFGLVINLKAAKSIGLTIPQSVLLRADEIIQ